MEDSDLIQRTLNGDRDAFAALVERYQARLYNLVIYVAGNQDEAEDVVQEAFVQAFSKLHTYAGRSSFFTWLYRIAFNASISRKRKQRERSLEMEENSAPLARDQEVDAGLVGAERAQSVRMALASLSPEHRAVLVLREVDGQDYASIAEILELPVGTVRSRIHRARAEMREYLSDLMEDHKTGG